MSEPLPIPEAAQAILARIPPHFHDDGCTRSPDSIFGFDFRWACRIHDWRYCSRAHVAGRMTYGYKVAADYELRENIESGPPWRWRWFAPIYQGAVLFAGGWNAFDSCGIERGPVCRHDLELPDWMRAQVEALEGLDGAALKRLAGQLA